MKRFFVFLVVIWVCPWGGAVWASDPASANALGLSPDSHIDQKDAGIIKAYREYLDSKKKNASLDDSQAAGATSEDYRIGVGDVLGISLWRDDKLSRQLTVLPDGSISFPLIGSIAAGGQTLEQLRSGLAERLEKFIPHPIISMEVIRVKSLMIYVIGKVNRPGRFELIGNIDVLQALSLAGGMNTYAKTDQVKVFRKTNKGTQILSFDYDGVSKGESLAQNIELKRGDVIVVP